MPGWTVGGAPPFSFSSVRIWKAVLLMTVLIHSKSAMPNHDQNTEPTSPPTCRDVVCSLGYLEKYYCSCESVPMSMNPVMEDIDYYRSLPSCTDDQRTRGLEDFQRTHELPVTGYCDEATAKVAAEGRCGVADDIIIDTDKLAAKYLGDMPRKAASWVEYIEVESESKENNNSRNTSVDGSLPNHDSLTSGDGESALSALKSAKESGAVSQSDHSLQKGISSGLSHKTIDSGAEDQSSRTEGKDSIASSHSYTKLTVAVGQSTLPYLASAELLPSSTKSASSTAEIAEQPTPTTGPIPSTAETTPTTESTKTETVSAPSIVQLGKLLASQRSLRSLRGKRKVKEYIRVEYREQDVSERSRLDIAYKETIAEADGDLPYAKMQQKRKLRNRRQESNQATRGEKRSKRTRRGAIVGATDIFPIPQGTQLQTTINWIAEGDMISNQQITRNVINTLIWAFRQWTMVTPLCFKRVTNANEAQISVSFEDRDHGDTTTCAAKFDGGLPMGPLLGHSRPKKFIHFDVAEDWALDGTTGFEVSLPKVALHEIGHVIGIPHLSHPKAVMYSAYSGMGGPEIMLQVEDRLIARNKYNRCRGRLDVVVDILITKRVNGVNERSISTFITRKRTSWLYSSRKGHALAPLLLSTDFINLPSNVANLEAVIQYSVPKPGYTREFVDEIFLLAGTGYYQFNGTHVTSRTKVSLSSKFNSGMVGGQIRSIPSPVDTAVFYPVDRRMYFFKGNQVYTYAYTHQNNDHKCCDSIGSIAAEFPAAGRSAKETLYQSRIDVAYYSNREKALFFIRDEYSYWYDPSAKLVRFIGNWNEHFNDVCETTCS